MSVCGRSAGAPAALKGGLVEAGRRVLTPQRSPYWEAVGSVVLRAYGGCYASSDGSSESS